jgi:addiction module HigA family antidote
MPRLRTHPGEVLAEEYLKPLGLSARALAQAVDVPANRISDIIRQRRDVSADTAIRLGRFFDVDPRFWLNLQAAYDLSLAENKHDYSDVRPRTDRSQRQMGSR